MFIQSSIRILVACLSLTLLLQCSPPPQVDMAFNRQTFVKDWRDEVIKKITTTIMGLKTTSFYSIEKMFLRFLKFAIR